MVNFRTFMPKSDEGNYTKKCSTWWKIDLAKNLEIAKILLGSLYMMVILCLIKE